MMTGSGAKHISTYRMTLTERWVVGSDGNDYYTCQAHPSTAGEIGLFRCHEDQASWFASPLVEREESGR